MYSSVIFTITSVVTLILVMQLMEMQIYEMLIFGPVA